MGLNDFILKKNKKNRKLAGLAVLFSRQILNGSQIFFCHSKTLFFIYFFKYEIIETHARAFLTLIILGIATVHSEPASAQGLLTVWSLWENPGMATG